MQPLFVVDAFTDRSFAGNPAGVLMLDAERDPTWMQAVASELNLSETSFLRRQEGGVWSLRWFTPVVENVLCGHATLAAAHVLWTEGHHPPHEPIRFATASGELRALKTGNGAIRLDFPATPPHPLSPPPDLEKIIPWPHRFVGRAEPTKNYLVEVDCPTVLRRLQPDLARLAALPAGGLIVTAASDDPAYDFSLPLLCSRCRDSGGSGNRLGPLHARSVLAREARQEPVSSAPSLASNRGVDARGERRSGRPWRKRSDYHSRITGCRYVELVMDRCTHCRTSYGSSGASLGTVRSPRGEKACAKTPWIGS